VHALTPAPLLAAESVGRVLGRGQKTGALSASAVVVDRTRGYICIVKLPEGLQPQRRGDARQLAVPSIARHVSSEEAQYLSAKLINAEKSGAAL
jgi:hypothetical protein